LGDRHLKSLRGIYLRGDIGGDKDAQGTQAYLTKKERKEKC